MRAARTSTPRGVLGSGLGVLLGFALWNLGNYAFFLLAGRILGPHDYGLVAALLAAALVIQTPFMSFAGALARVVGGRADRGEGVYALALRRATVATVAAGVLAAAAILVAGAIDDRVATGPLLATLATLLPAAVLPLGFGQLQGEHDFRRFATGMASFGLPRPVALAVLAAAGLGIYAALLGTAVTAFIALAVVLGYTMRPARAAPADASGEAWRDFSRSLLPFFVGIAAFSALTNVDVVVAKLALGGDDAGIFASAAVIAKSVLVIPQAIATIAIPRIAARRSAGRPTSTLLAIQAGATIAAGLVVTGVVAVLRDPLVTITFGDEYADAAGLLVAFTAAMSLMGVVLILLYHQLALGRYGYAWVLLGVALLQVVLLAGFHGSADAIVAVDAIVAGVAVIAHEILPGRGGDRLWRGVAAEVRRYASRRDRR
ncbi:MAG TPA: oligosaccharide flippase family protein [Miltoncostaea sp.]|nr:oligosaccharide flippase family protein [Miltoncostaea sp.]